MKNTTRLSILAAIASLLLAIGNSYAGKRDSGTTAPSCEVEPIIMIHGFMGATSNFNNMETRLQSDQPACALFKFGYNSIGDSNKTSAAKLKVFVESALSTTGQAKARLVAHSNGGLVSRWYRVFEGGANQSSKLITLGSPHEGTTWAYGCVSPACYEMRPNSDFLKTLAGKGCDISLWSNADEIILPNSSAKCGRSIQTNSASHNGMLSDAIVYNDVKNNL